jgi:hypothetical protein
MLSIVKSVCYDPHDFSLQAFLGLYAMKNHIINAKSLVLASYLVTLTFPVSVLAEAGAKSLFISIDDNDSSSANKSKPLISNSKKSPRNKKHQFSTNTSASSSEYTGLQYWIDLQDDKGQSRRVTTSHNFRSGDRIKLQIKSGSSGYLYVINQDTSGQQTYLYPPKGQQSELIEQGMLYTIPVRGTIRFDNVPSNEKITVALSKFPILQSDLASASKENMTSSTEPSPYSACADNNAGTKKLYIEESIGITDCIRKNYSAGTKGMYSEEDTHSNEPASYSVLPASSLNEGKVMFVDFNLIHH